VGARFPTVDSGYRLGQMPNRILSNRYELRRVVGRGGMAEVWEAQDRVLGRRVAVKVLHPSLAGDPTFIERFRREATAAASLNHRSMVAIYDAGVDGDANYLVMEFLDGETLADLVARVGRIDIDKTVEVGIAMCDALHAVHQVGLVHRDVKPANIMVTPSGGAKLMDLGIARGPELTSLTATASVIGTAGYLSPEQAGGKPASAQSDLYGLGWVLFEAATGRRPFDADSPVAMAIKHLSEAPPVPSSVVPGLPAWFDHLIARALAKDPDQRYRDAEEMSADLGRIATGVPVTASAPIARTAVAPIPGPTPTAVQPRPVSSNDDGAPPRKVRGTILGLVALVALLVVGGLVAAAAGWFDTEQGASPGGPTEDTQDPDGEPDTDDAPPDDTEPEAPEEDTTEPEETTTVPPETDFTELDAALGELADAADSALADGEIDQSARDNLVAKAADAVDKARDGDDDALDQIESLRDDLEDLSEELHSSSFQAIRRTIDQLEREIRNIL
jgi:eukaryotic-like serine/threonine-protein kinase